MRGMAHVRHAAGGHAGGWQGQAPPARPDRGLPRPPLREGPSGSRDDDATHDRVPPMFYDKDTPPVHPATRPAEETCFLARDVEMDAAEGQTRLALLADAPGGALALAVDALRAAMATLPDAADKNLSIRPFYPECFLLMFSSQRTRDAAMRAGSVPVGDVRSEGVFPGGPVQHTARRQPVQRARPAVPPAASPTCSSPPTDDFPALSSAPSATPARPGQNAPPRPTSTQPAPASVHEATLTGSAIPVSNLETKVLHRAVTPLSLQQPCHTAPDAVRVLSPARRTSPRLPTATIAASAGMGAPGILVARCNAGSDAMERGRSRTFMPGEFSAGQRP
nr:mucin-7-like [Setaria viridis]